MVRVLSKAFRRISSALRHSKPVSALRLREAFGLFRKNGGVAMILAVSAVTLIMYLAMEVMYDSTVEYTVNAQSLNRLKAYYAARSGVDLSLLRIKIYQSVKGKMGNNPAFASYAPMIDMIWKFPFSWPLIPPEGLNSVDKEAFGDFSAESLMDASYSVGIEDEGSKLDINDLVSPSKTLRELTKKRLLQIFQQKVEEDEDFQRKYGNTRWEEDVINPIADWMSDKNTSVGGGDKRQGYADLNRDGDHYPPNRGFRTLEELRMVSGMREDFFALLAPRITIFGMRGVNPNVANKETLKSLDPGINDEVAGKIISRREDQEKGPFRDAADFWSFVQGEAGARLTVTDTKEIPLSFETLTSFRIKSSGEFGGAVREIVAIVLDVNRTAANIKKFVDEDKKNEAGQQQPQNPTNPGSRAAGGTGQPNQQNQQVSPSKGPPRIVYWAER